MESFKIDKIKKYKLRNKLENIIRKANLQPCKNHQSHLSNLDLKITNFYEGEVYHSKLINNSLNFLYSNHSDEEELKRKKISDFDKENEIKFSKEKDYIFKLLLRELTNEEIKIISRDVEYYIKDNYLRKVIDLFNDNYQLYQTLTLEEKNGKVENEDERVKRLIRNKKNYLINKNNNENSNQFKFDFLKRENESMRKLKEKIKFQKRLFFKKKFLNENHTQIINNIISTSEREINNTNKYLSNNNLQKQKFMKSLKNIKNIPSSYNQTKYKRKIKLNDNLFNHIRTNSNTINNFSSLSSDKFFSPKKEKGKFKLKINKLKKRLLDKEKEKESINFINRYTLEIKKIFQTQIQKNLPKINTKNKTENNIILNN